MVTDEQFQDVLNRLHKLENNVTARNVQALDKDIKQIKKTFESMNKTVNSNRDHCRQLDANIKQLETNFKTMVLQDRGSGPTS